mgnify:CR=1 FL=1
MCFYGTACSVLYGANLLALAFIKYIQVCTHLSMHYLMDSFTSSPRTKRLLLHRSSYVTQRESKGRLETLIQSWTDEQVENPIGMYASSKQVNGTSGKPTKVETKE